MKDSIDESCFSWRKSCYRSKFRSKKDEANINNVSLPFMTWSAGQKEFMSFLLGNVSSLLGYYICNQ